MRNKRNRLFRTLAMVMLLFITAFTVTGNAFDAESADVSSVTEISEVSKISESSDEAQTTAESDSSFIELLIFIPAFAVLAVVINSKAFKA